MLLLTAAAPMPKVLLVPPADHAPKLAVGAALRLMSRVVPSTLMFRVPLAGARAPLQLTLVTWVPVASTVPLVQAVLPKLMLMLLKKPVPVMLVVALPVCS